MRRVGRGDDDRVDVRVADDAERVPVHARPGRVRRARAARARLVDVAHRGHRRAVHLALQQAHVDRPHHPGADDADASDAGHAPQTAVGKCMWPA